MSKIRVGAGKILGVLHLKGEPFRRGGCGIGVAAVEEDGSARDGRGDEGHAVVVERGAPLAHSRVHRVEDQECILPRAFC